MIRFSPLDFTRSARAAAAVLALFALLTVNAMPALSMEATRNGPLPRPFPLFPSDNWWNQDISSWPIDPNSTGYIGFINNGGVRRLHPDLGGNAASGQYPYAIYGMPYAVVTNVTNADRKPVQFDYWDESDGVDRRTGLGLPFYPIPPQAATQPYWIEGGDPGNVDRRNNQDRHMLIIDGDHNHLYELYNVYYSAAQRKWFAGSGAFFAMNSNDRRPNGWTSADAAGLAIFPGLIRYDEVYDPTVEDIGHAFRVTVRATNGYVYPASHRAGSTPGALPMGARLRLKASVDVTERTSDPDVQKIFRAMQKYGLIVADNGSDMYITGTYDTRWNNGILNPAFAALTASDFEVVQLGYSPASAPETALASLSITPAAMTGGQSGTGTVKLTDPAPAGGITVSLSSAIPALDVPVSVTIGAGATTATFAVTALPVEATASGNISAAYAGVTKTAIVTVTKSNVALSSVTVQPRTITGGDSVIGTVNLNGPAPAGGAVVRLASKRPGKADVPPNVTVPAGSVSAQFEIATAVVKSKIAVTISASYGPVTKKATLTVQKRKPAPKTSAKSEIGR